MLVLNEQQQQALDQARDAPTRAPEAGEVVVLLPSADFDWVRQTLGDEPEAVRALDPRSGAAFALVPEARYERFKAFFEEGPLTPAEREFLLREAGRRAGWDGPGWEAPAEGPPQIA